MTGTALLEIFYRLPLQKKGYLPPMVIVPMQNFDSLHLFLLSINDVETFERTWLPERYRRVCNGKWLYHIRVRNTVCDQIAHINAAAKQ